MSTNTPGNPILPDTVEFNLDEAIPINPSGTESVTIPLPLGKDIAFNFFTGTLDTTLSQSSTWVRQANETRALNQWVTVALLTPRGHYLIYPEDFGSNLHTLVGMGLPLSALGAEIPQMLEEALMAHDRIVGLDNIKIWQQREALTVSFQVILDDDARLDYQANLSF